MSFAKEKTAETSETAVVESIVREVIERICRESFNEKGLNGNSSVSADLRLEIFSKVVTLDRLHGKLDGIRVVAVNSGAIVTPAVHDELKILGIELEILSSTEFAKTNQKITFCVARLSSHFFPVDWLRELGDVQVCCGVDYRELADQLVDRSLPGKTICFATQPFVAVSALNRKQELRVAYGRTEKEIAEIKLSLDANVLVLDAVQPRKEQLALIRFFVNDRKGAA